MTWRELFRRAWLVLRLRFKRFHFCTECGDVMDRGAERTDIAGLRYNEPFCPSCEEFRRLERERCKGDATVGALNGWQHLADQAAALQNVAPGALLAYQQGGRQARSHEEFMQMLSQSIGSPIRIPAQNAIVHAIVDGEQGYFWS